MMYPQLGTVIRRRDDPKLSFYQAWQERSSSQLHVHWFFAVRERLSLSEVVIDTALTYVERLRKRQLFIGEHFVKEGALLLACRMHGVPRGAREIACASDHSRLKPFKVVRRAYEIANALGIDVRRAEADRAIFSGVEKLGLPRDYYRFLMDLLVKLDYEFPSGHRRETDAASLLWFLANRNGRPCTQRGVAMALGVTESSVRQRVGELRKIGAMD